MIPNYDNSYLFDEERYEDLYSCNEPKQNDDYDEDE